MSDYLPYGRFKWLKNVDRYNVNSKFAVSYEMLSKYCKKIADKYRIKVGDVQKLIPNLGNKTNYQLHYRNLQLYLFLGMKLTKIQRVWKFKQSDWMKKCINFNTEKRKNAANSFEKDFFLSLSAAFMAKQWKACEKE